MSGESNKKIIFLPFLSGESFSWLKELEGIILLGIEYKLFPAHNAKIADLTIKPLPTDVKSLNGGYSMKDLLTLSARNNSKYALVGKFEQIKDQSEIKIIFNFYNMQITELIETWETPAGMIKASANGYDIDLEMFNIFLKDCACIILNLINIELNEFLTQYLNLKLINNVISFSNLVKAKKIEKVSSEKLKYLDKSIQEDSKMEFAYLEKARLLKNKRNYKEAIDNYKNAINKSLSNYHKAIYGNELGLCYALSKNYQDAFEIWEKATEYNPDYINPYMNLALTYEEKGVYAKAEQYFIEIQKLDPSDCRTYFNLARLYSKTGNWIKAIDQYKDQLKMNPYDAWSHSNIGNCYLQLGKNKEAKSFFFKTIDLDPDGEAGNYANQVLEALEESSKRDWWKFWRK